MAGTGASELGEEGWAVLSCTIPPELSVVSRIRSESAVFSRASRLASNEVAGPCPTAVDEAGDALAASAVACAASADGDDEDVPEDDDAVA